MVSIGLSLTAGQLPEKSLAFTNKIYASEADFQNLAGSSSASVRSILVEINGGVLTLEAHKSLAEGVITFNLVHRNWLRIAIPSEVYVKRFVPPQNFVLGCLRLEADFVAPRDATQASIKDADMEQVIKRNLKGQALSKGQSVIVDLDGATPPLKLTVLGAQGIDLGDGKEPQQMVSGLLDDQTSCDFVNGTSGKVHILSEKAQTRSIFRPDFNFEELGIGGLDKEFGDIFRRAFASRVFPPTFIRDMGINHVRGMLLHGPPGTGKTLIARQLAKFLKAVEPKIVNGPEILNKYVGQAEENIRNLFADAEKEMQQQGEASQLHVVIFDEIDSICKSRGSKADSTGVHDSIVNQLLSKIDGVNALNNILLIGMTNRMDLIDEALLRPGRLEVHVEISLPDEAGRQQILNIHTKNAREKNLLDKTVSLPAIAAQTKNFSGAELEGLIRSACSFAINREVPKEKIGQSLGDLSAFKVMGEDFEKALSEVKPQFGAHEDDFEACTRLGIMHYCQDFDNLMSQCDSLIEQVRHSDNTPLLTMLMYGPPGCGKTALSAYLASRSEYNYMRRIGPDSLVGYTEMGKISRITKIFEDAYKSPLSIIVLDDIERLMDYVPIGPRFSVNVLSAIFSLLKKPPPKANRRLLVIGTTSAKGFFQETELFRAFNVALNIPVLMESAHFKHVLEKRPGFTAPVVAEICAELDRKALGIRTVLLVAEMAMQRQDPVSKQVFMECLRVAGDE